MSFCPRCVQPVPPGASSCPQCDYDIASIDAATGTPPDLGRDSPGADPPPAQGAGWSPLGAWDEHEDVALTRANLRSTRVRPVWELRLRSRLPLVASLAAIAIIAALIATHPGDHGTTLAIPGVGSSAKTNASHVSQPPENGQQQATVIDRFLTQSATARDGVSNAIESIDDCRNIADAVATLSAAADARTRILAGLTDAQVTALPGGPTMLADLQQGLRASAAADTDYAAWGTTTETSCTGKASPTTSYAAAQQSDAIATAAKQRFVQSWNAVAAQFGLTPQNASTI
jgi:hypothetical protein